MTSPAPKKQFCLQVVQTFDGAASRAAGWHRLIRHGLVMLPGHKVVSRHRHSAGGTLHSVNAVLLRWQLFCQKTTHEVVVAAVLGHQLLLCRLILTLLPPPPSPPTTPAKQASRSVEEMRGEDKGKGGVWQWPRRPRYKCMFVGVDSCAYE
jgi:hypothetical protein